MLTLTVRVKFDFWLRKLTLEPLPGPDIIGESALFTSPALYIETTRCLIFCAIDEAWITVVLVLLLLYYCSTTVIHG